jgi:hypothetical protein
LLKLIGGVAALVMLSAMALPFSEGVEGQAVDPAMIPPECAGMTFDDMFIGTEDYDQFDGTGLRELVILNGEEDIAYGGGGNDCIVGGDDDGGDHMWGGSGNDVIIGGSGGGDVANGGSGTDRCYGVESATSC